MRDAAPYLIKKVGAARIRQVSEVANEVRDRKLVARAAMSLKNCHGLALKAARYVAWATHHRASNRHRQGRTVQAGIFEK
jgi:hypothetical protein